MQLKTNTGIVVNFVHWGASENGSIYSISDNRQYFCKIEAVKLDAKLNDLVAETRILGLLNERGCQTSPTLVGSGMVSVKSIRTHIQKELENRLGSLPADRELPYYITDYYPGMSTIYTPDIMMAVIEQKKLGIWHADLRPEHIRHDPRTNTIKLIDYDQALQLTEAQRTMNNLEFFRWVDDYAREYYKAWNLNGWLHYFLPGNVTWESHFKVFLDEQGSFDIGKTWMFSSQETTLDPNKIYHAFHYSDVRAEGERSLNERKTLLDRIDFKKGERILDIGCNAGLLCHYLHDRGGDVWGVDIDPYVVSGARIIANIIGKSDINFAAMDLDQGGLVGHFDTVMLFSVIHHTRRMRENAARICELCDRVIVECRTEESGAKPVSGKEWVATTIWSHPDKDALIDGLEHLFPGFKHNRTIGRADRDRYMFEFLKERS